MLLQDCVAIFMDDKVAPALSKCRLIKAIVLHDVLCQNIVSLKGILLFFYFFQTQRFHVKHFVLPILYLKEKGALKNTPSVQEDFSSCLSDCQFQIFVLQRFSLFSTMPISYQMKQELTHFAKFRQNVDLKMLMFIAFTFLYKCVNIQALYIVSTGALT